jgi:hypothetical protein
LSRTAAPRIVNDIVLKIPISHSELDSSDQETRRGFRPSLAVVHEQQSLPALLYQ